MKKLFQLQVGDKFLFNNKRYTVNQQDRNMTEVWENGKFWCWPSSASVKII